MYASQEARDGDIEKLSGADPGVLRDRLLASTTAIHDAVEELPDGPLLPAGSSAPRAATGRSRAGRVGEMRLREVEIHHADLDLAYTWADWPSDFTALLLDGRSKVPRRRPVHGVRRRPGPLVGVRRRATGPRSAAPERRWHGGRRAGTRVTVLTSDAASCPARRRGEMTVTLHRRREGGRRRPDVRELEHLTITKVAVDEQMSNNAYLLRCNAHRRPGPHRRGRRARDPAPPHRRRRPDLGGHHPPALGPPPGARRRHRRPPGGHRRRGRGRRRDHDPDRRAYRPGRHRRPHRRGRRLHPRGHRHRRPHPRLDRAALRRLASEGGTRTCSPATRCSPAASATPSATPRRSSSSSTTSRPSSSPGCPTTPGSTPATATTRRSASSGRTSRSGASGAGEPWRPPTPEAFTSMLGRR